MSKNSFRNALEQPANSLQAFMGSTDNQSPVLTSAFSNFGVWIDDANGNHPNIALFRLATNMPQTNLIRTIRLPRLIDENFGFDDFNVTTVGKYFSTIKIKSFSNSLLQGWGRMSNGNFPRILQYGNFRILASHLCFWNRSFSQNDFCSQHQNLNSMVSIERGEGGGSIITESDGIATLVGITSVTLGMPNGAAACSLRVSSFLRFINQNTGIPFR